jgi:hypothetical protein
VPQSDRAVLEAVRRRLQDEPGVVRPVLELIADPEATVAADDEATISLARTLNAHRVVALLREFRARSYSTAQVAALLGGVSRQAVSQRVANKRLLAADISRQWWFPAWQFPDGRPAAGLPDLVRVFAELGEDAFGADAVMRTALPEEGGRTPADLLAAGDLARALHYARVVGAGF